MNQRVRTKYKALHGARGYICLQRKYKMIDDDNSKRLSVAEFKNAKRSKDIRFKWTNKPFDSN